MTGAAHWPIYDVTQGFTPELGPCVVISATYADGLTFDQRCLPPGRARTLGMQLIDAAAKSEEAARAAAKAATG